MLVRLFRQSEPILAVVLLFLVIITASTSYFWHFRTIPANGVPFYDMTYNLFSTWPSWARVVVVSILFYSQAIHLHFLLSRHEVIAKTSWLPALMYVIIGSVLPPFQWFHPMIFVNSLLLLAIDKIFYLYKNDKPLSLDFDIGFIIGLASLFYLPIFIYIFFFGSALILLRPFSWRDWITGIIGVFLPLFFAFCYYFLTDHLMLLYEKIVLSGIRRPLSLAEIFPKGYMYSILLILIIVVTAIFKQQANFYKNVTKTRLNQWVFFLFAITGVTTSLFTETPLIYRFYILAIPLSVWAGYFFLNTKRVWLAEFVLLFLIGCWIYNYSIG